MENKIEKMKKVIIAAVVLIVIMLAIIIVLLFKQMSSSGDESIMSTKKTTGATSTTETTCGHIFGIWYEESSTSCELPHKKTRRCNICGFTETEEVAAPGHVFKTKVVEPSCENEGYTLNECEKCHYSTKTEQKDALGHSFSGSICTRCDAVNKIDMRTRISAPIGGGFIGKKQYVYFAFDFDAQNISGKDIKYMTLTLEFYNKVDDLLVRKSYKYTGPFKADETFHIYNNLEMDYGLYIKNATSWNNLSKVRISEIKVEYFDGTIECGEYGYTTTQYKD